MTAEAQDKRSPAGVAFRPHVISRPRVTGQRPTRGLLRYGVSPFLLAADLLAWLVAASAASSGVVRDLVLLVVAVALYTSAGLYRSRLSLSVLDDLPVLLGRALAATGIATASVVLLFPERADVGLVRTALTFGVAVVALRAAAYALVRGCRARGLISHPTLVLGAGRVGGQIASALLAHPSYGLRPVGFLDEDPLLSPEQRPIPLLGGQNALAGTILEFGVQDVIVAFGGLPESQMIDIIRTCDRLDVEIFLVPRLFELQQTSRDMDQVWGVPLVRLGRAPFRSPRWRLKRVLDVVVSGVALVAVAPLLLGLTLAVRLENGPGVLFRQERIGIDGRPFELLKLRTLRVLDDADSALTWSVAGDVRLGPVGRLLRATSLDELPQLWNILRGDMTLVGPRPERPYFASTFSRTFPRYTARHRVPAGLTGWAQVHGLRGDTSIADRARFDNYYIENWSMWGDVKILCRTVFPVLRRTGG